MSHKKASELVAGDVYVSDEDVYGVPVGTEYKVLSAKARRHLMSVELEAVDGGKQRQLPFLATELVQVKDQVKVPTFVIMGQCYWGKGEDLAGAKREFRKQGGTLNLGYTVFEFDAETEFGGVDGMGYIHWNGNQPTRTEVKAKVKQ